MKQALTNMEWAQQQAIGRMAWWHVLLSIKDIVEPPSIGRQQIAALMLVDQPFGFTWDDVDALRACADVALGLRPLDGTEWDEELLRRGNRTYDIAGRIAALLPPREHT